MVQCSQSYLTSWMSPLIDQKYYRDTQFGYCLPDGVVLNIKGLPEDSVSQNFQLSIFNKNKTAEGNTDLKQFLQLYLPKYHYSVPSRDIKGHSFEYNINTIVFNRFNITTPVVQNLSLSKVAIHFDEDINYNANP
jgi:hypothetical protein